MRINSLFLFLFLFLFFFLLCTIPAYGHTTFIFTGWLILGLFPVSACALLSLGKRLEESGRITPGSFGRAVPTVAVPFSVPAGSVCPGPPAVADTRVAMDVSISLGRLMTSIFPWDHLRSLCLLRCSVCSGFAQFGAGGGGRGLGCESNFLMERESVRCFHLV